MNSDEFKFVKEARAFFENPGLFVKGLNLLAVPIEKAQQILPKPIQSRLKGTIEKALTRALQVSLKSLSAAKGTGDLVFAQKRALRSGKLHSLLTAATGGIGGLFGAPAVIVELPISTIVMLRSIADIARESGADMSHPETALECLFVFCLGGPSKKDDLTDSAYYGTRLALAAAVREATIFLTSLQAKQVAQAIESGTAPAVVKYIAKVAAQFEVRVTKKLLAQATPIIGAAGGAVVNVAFSEFFNKCARYHFGLRQLERKYGADAVEHLYGSRGGQNPA